MNRNPCVEGRIASWLEECSRKKDAEFRITLVTMDGFVADVEFGAENITVCRQGSEVISVQLVPKKIHSMKWAGKGTVKNKNRPRTFIWKKQGKNCKHSTPAVIRILHPGDAVPKAAAKKPQPKK